MHPILRLVGARDRNRTGTPVIHEAADFKSDVSTYFTTRAHGSIVNQNVCATALGQKHMA